MSWFNDFGQRLKSLVGQRHSDTDDVDEIQEPQIESSLGSFGQLMISVLVFPLQLLFLPARVLGLFHQSGVQYEDYEGQQGLSGGKKLWHKAKSVGWDILMLPYMIVTAPVRFLRGVANSGLREALFVIPALVMLGFLGYVGLQVLGRSETIHNRYAEEVKQAMKDGEFKKAKTYFTRIMQDRELTQPQKLQWMVVLAETGEKEKANQILDELAPDDGVGYPPAHRAKALRIAFSRNNRNAPLPLKKLENHLTRSREHTPLIQQAWAIYYRSIDNPDKAIEALKVAAQTDPALHIAIAKYEGELNRQEDRQQTLRNAEQKFKQILEQDPMNSRARCLLASSISQQDRLDEAQNILLEGLEINGDGTIRKANAEFFTMRHDQERANQNRVGKRVTYLFQALGANPNHFPIYERLIALTNEKNSDGDNFVRVRNELNHLIAGDHPNPMAHFALSNIFWQHEEFEKATVHLELAYKIEPRFTFVLNNLAWVLAHRDPPDLDRALELAKQAVKTSPKDGRYHDTLGTIYMKLEQYKDAAAEFELSLPTVRNKINVRKKLVDVYTKLGMLEQAKIQEDMIESSSETAQ